MEIDETTMILYHFDDETGSFDNLTFEAKDFDGFSKVYSNN